MSARATTSPTTAPPPPPHSKPTGVRNWMSTFTSLRERDYAWYFAGNIAFFMGMQMQMILRGYLALELTNVAIALGLVAASVAIPMLLVAPFGGTVADRVNKRKLLMISQTGSAIAALIMALLILSDAVEFWHLLVMSLVTGIIMSFNMPARQAIVPQLVPQHKLMNAISLQQAGMNLTRILAPATAGLLIGPLGVGTVYLITFGLFVVAVASELHLPVHGMKAVQRRASFREDFFGGFRYIKQHRLIALLLTVGLVFPLFGFPLQQMLPVFARDVFNDDGGSKLGLLAASQGIGGLAGAMIAANLGGFPHKGRLMLVGGLWMGGLFIAFTQMSLFLPALLMLALGNVGGMVFQTTNNTVIQSSIPAEVRGRVMSVMMMSFGLMPLGVLPVAAASDEFGPDVAVAGSSALLVIALLTFFTLSKRLRTLQLDQLRQVELSPAQAATAVAEGRLTQEEADRLSGQDDGPRLDDGTPPEPRISPAPVSAAEPSEEQPADDALEPRVAVGPPQETPGLVAARVAPQRSAGTARISSPRKQDDGPKSGRGWRRPAMVSSAFGLGLVFGFAASGSGEVMHWIRSGLARLLDSGVSDRSPGGRR